MSIHYQFLFVDKLYKLYIICNIHFIYTEISVDSDTAEEKTLMEPIAILVITIVSVIAFAWLLQGIRLYKSCKGDIYNDIYGSFLAYFYRYVVLRNCSESGYLRGKIGVHRIVYSSLTKEGGGKSKFCVIFYNKGIMVVSYDRATGQYLGNPNQKNWNVIRPDKEGKNHTYRHPNPTADTKAYVARISKLFPGVHMEARIAFHNQADFSSLRTDIKPIHFSELADALTQVKADFVSDSEIIAMHNLLVKG